jgi:hypothetical protein
MESIFGHDMATGRFVQGLGEALGVNQADSVAAKAEGAPFPQVPAAKTQTKTGEGRKAIELLSSDVGGKEEDGQLY